jgi:nuclear autoantigenic sperm protein
MQHLAAGKRNLLVQDLTAAVSSLGQACEMLGKHFGETAKECGEPYFLYGKALLDLARAEAGVIDNGLEGGKNLAFLFLNHFTFRCVYVN